ncbi:MAG: S41 family peptidase [Pseudomonadota bacterium]
MQKILFTLCLVVSACAVEDSGRPIDTGPDGKLVKAVSQLCALVEMRYAYFDKVSDYWNESCDRAELEARSDGSSPQTLDVLERLIDDLYDPHVNLNTNDVTSPRLIPSGADLAFRKVDGAYRVAAIRPLTSAAEANIEVGDQLVSFNQSTPEQMILERVHSGRKYISEERKSWAINAVIGGRYNEPRQLVLLRGGREFVHDLGDPQPSAPDRLLSFRKLNNNLGYIRFNNSLGADQTVDEFNKAIAALSETDGLILDLRDTPGGGNTGVAEPILGHFIDFEAPYQVTAPKGAPAYERVINPTTSTAYTQPVLVLVGRWTGSMGEGMAIGLDGMGRATVLGSQMARLAGGTEGVELVDSGITVFLPTYDLRHLDGTPRHKWIPKGDNFLSADFGNSEDLLLNTAIERLTNTKNRRIQ